MNFFSYARELSSKLFTAVPEVALRQEEELKANPAFLAMPNIYGDAPQPHLMPRNYKTYAKEGFRTDATLYKCITYIARNGAAIPPKLYTDRTRHKEIRAHPLLDRLNSPNPEQSGVAYREAVLGFLLISGNSYQYAIRTTKNGPPDELWTLRPDYIQIVANKTKGITGYFYNPAKILYDKTDVGHMKYWCPDDDIYGLSPMEIAAILVDQQTAARKWNLALLQNWARLPGAWVVPTPLSRNDRERLESRLKERLQGFKNAGTPPVLDGGLKWESMGVPPAQMDWLEGLGLNAVQIATIYGLAPMVIGDTSATTFNNMKQAEAYSYTEGIFPDLDKFYDLLNVWLVPMYPDLARSGAYLYYDKETVEVIQDLLQAQKDAQVQRASKMFGAGDCTLNEARALQGLPRDPQGDVYRFGDILVPASRLLEYANQSLLVGPATPALPRAEGSPYFNPAPTTSETLSPKPEVTPKPNTPEASPGSTPKPSAIPKTIEPTFEEAVSDRRTFVDKLPTVGNLSPTFEEAVSDRRTEYQLFLEALT